MGDPAPDLANAYAADSSDNDLRYSGESMKLKETRGDIAVFEYVRDGQSESLE